MKNFHRSDLLFSLCGLNCGLCPMNLGGYCPGCGGGPGNQPCAIARCRRDHGGVEYCWQCADYPCPTYGREDQYDSFITHRGRLRDLERCRTIGPQAYQAEQREKIALLRELLAHYNDGRKKTLFCAAVNLLDLAALGRVTARLRADALPDAVPLKERAARAAALLQAEAETAGVSLKLRRKSN